MLDVVRYLALQNRGGKNRSSPWKDQLIKWLISRQHCDRDVCYS